jgi:hypothetical protein
MAAGGPVGQAFKGEEMSVATARLSNLLCMIYMTLNLMSVVIGSSAEAMHEQGMAESLSLYNSNKPTRPSVAHQLPISCPSVAHQLPISCPRSTNQHISSTCGLPVAVP